MEELSINKDNLIFRLYPSEEQAKKNGDFSFFSLGEEYLGGGRMGMSTMVDGGENNTAYGILLAWNKEGKVIFRGGVDYCKGIVALGQTSGSFQRAKEYRGYGIGRKMAVVGLIVAKEFVEKEGLPLKEIALNTDPNSRMATIGKVLGMTDKEGMGFYRRSDFPDLNKLAKELGIKKTN